MLWSVWCTEWPGFYWWNLYVLEHNKYYKLIATFFPSRICQTKNFLFCPKTSSYLLQATKSIPLTPRCKMKVLLLFIQLFNFFHLLFNRRFIYDVSNLNNRKMKMYDGEFTIEAPFYLDKFVTDYFQVLDVQQVLLK